MLPSKTHVNDSIRQVDDHTWRIADRLLLCRQPSPSPSPDEPSWSDGQGGFFVLSTAPQPPRASRPLAEDSAELPRVHAAGDQSAVWRAGEAFIKAHDVRWPRATREHVTLEFLASRQQPLGFDVPRVLFHAEFDGRYYLVLTRVPGRTLSQVWPEADEAARQRYVRRVADICRKLAEWESGAISGVDGRLLLEVYLTKDESADSLDPDRLLQNCRAMSMDVSSPFVFYHCDLGPGNILVDEMEDAIGIIDWELAGYVPREWVKTKFNLSSGMDFPDVEGPERSDWRRLVARRLAEMGFTDVIDGWLQFHRS